MNNQSSFDRFLHYGDYPDDSDMNRQMLESDSISPDLYEKMGLLKRAPIPSSIECQTCDQYASIVPWNNKIIAFCPCCGRYEPLEEELIWWTPCFAPVIQSLYDGFCCSEETECLISGILWKLGRCALAGQSRVIYVARGINSNKNSDIVEKLPENRTSLLFVFGSLPQNGKSGTFDADKVFSINSLMTLGEAGFNVNKDPVVQTLDLLNGTHPRAVRGPGKYSKIGGLREKIQIMLEDFMHGVYCEKEQYLNSGHEYVFKKITQVQLAEAFGVTPTMVNNAINKKAFLKGLYKRACDPVAAYNYGRSLEKKTLH